jgi:hypothetical protein
MQKRSLCRDLVQKDQSINQSINQSVNKRGGIGFLRKETLLDYRNDGMPYSA